MFDLAIPVIHTAPAVIDAATVVVKTAIDTSFTSDPIVQFFSRIGGILVFCVMIWRGAYIYADPKKRGELWTEAGAAIVAVGFVFFPEAMLKLFGFLAGLVIAIFTGQNPFAG